MRLHLFLPHRHPPGALRRALGALGPSWASSPVRRVVQGGFLVLFGVLVFYVCYPQGAPDYAEAMEHREFIDAETFLAMDPLVGISAAVAGRAWVRSLAWAIPVLVVCIIIPRAFCGYVCPLGTLIDLFDWSIGRRVTRARPRGWWAHLKYALLAATLVASIFGVLLSGFVSAIPVLTRGMQFIFAPLQIGVLREWHLVPPIGAVQFVSIALFCAVFALSLLTPRFWCRYVCPSGAIFSIASLLRITRRKVTAGCIECNRCVKACPFDAIRSDFSTRDTECTSCQTCGGACPTRAIEFVPRWDRRDERCVDRAPRGEISLSRRRFLAGTAGGVLGGALVATGVRKLFGAELDGASPLPVRPPGSVPEDRFLATCIGCGACMKACSTNILQPLGLRQGIEGLWTPHAVANWAACAPECNLCGKVCPTGAIRELPLDEKRAARMGLAVINLQTCLPHAQRQECLLCVDACNSIGYNAIEFILVGVEVDEQGSPVEDSGYLAPAVLACKCVGCGLCQNQCHSVNVLQERLLKSSAVVVEAGDGKDDRIIRGSYRALREAERRKKRQSRSTRGKVGGTGDYLPDFLAE